MNVLSSSNLVHLLEQFSTQEFVEGMRRLYLNLYVSHRRSQPHW